MDAPVADLYKRGFTKYTVNLADYVGKDIRIGFRYKAKDCDMVMLDDVRVNVPELEDVAYSLPLSTLFWGLNREEGWGSIVPSIALYPVDTPITWTNISPEGASYSWSYTDPEDPGENGSSDNGSELTLIYHPSAEILAADPLHRNFYEYPTLMAEAPGAEKMTYQWAEAPFQAGGMPDAGGKDDDGKMVSDPRTLFPFDPAKDGLTFLTLDDPGIGDMAIPVFGYNENVDEYWLNYTMNGEDPAPGDYSHLTAILNRVIPTGGNFVMTGSTVYAAGKVPLSSEIEFTLELIPLGEGNTLDLEKNPPVATAKVTADKILHTAYGANDLLTIPFDFAAPCLLEGEGNGYVVRFSGFHNPLIEYFEPLQSEFPFKDERLIGWFERHTHIEGFEEGVSYSPMAYVEGLHGVCLNAFAIGLDGYYPYLAATAEEVEVTADGEPTEYPLVSYYPGSELEVSVPMGVVAEVTGRYEEARLILRHDDTEVIAEGDVILTAPGVSLSLPLKEVSGVALREGYAPQVKEILRADGSVVTSVSGGGVYILRYSDGTARKILR